MAKLTPLMVECVLHHGVSPARFPNMQPSRYNAPAVVEQQLRLVDLGLLASRSPDTYGAMDSPYRLTVRGQEFFDRLVSLDPDDVDSGDKQEQDVTPPTLEAADPWPHVVEDFRRQLVIAALTGAVARIWTIGSSTVRSDEIADEAVRIADAVMRKLGLKLSE